MLWYIVVPYLAWVSHNLPPHAAEYRLGPYTLDICERLAEQEYKDIMDIGKMQLLEKPYCEMVPPQE